MHLRMRQWLSRFLLALVLSLFPAIPSAQAEGNTDHALAIDVPESDPPMALEFSFFGLPPLWPGNEGQLLTPEEQKNALLLSQGPVDPNRPLISLPRPQTASPFFQYTVQSGDSLSAIAHLFDVDLQTLIALNNIEDPALIRTGQILQLPARWEKGNHWPGAVTQVLTATLTAYTAGPESTGKEPGDPGYGITASGTRVQDGRTIAVDPRKIPLGSRVYIEGIGYRVAEDTGGAIQGNRIDVYMSNLQDAIRFGVKKGVKVYVLAPVAANSSS